MNAWDGSLHLPKMGYTPDDDPRQIFEAMTLHAMTEIGNALQGKTGIAKVLGMRLESGQTALPITGGFSEHDARFLTDVLWQDRKTFLLICRRGLLNGSTALLFTISTLLQLSPGVQ